MVRLFSFAVLFLFVVASSSSVQAHSDFKKMMEKEYAHLKITCNACHEKGKKKDVRNEFGQAVHKKFASEKFTEQLDKFEDRDEKKKFMEEKVLPVVKKGLKETIEKEKNKAGDSWADLVKNGTLPGVKLKED